MKHTRLSTSFALLAVSLLAAGFTSVAFAQGFKAGAGQAVGDANITDEQAQKLVESAIDEALKNFGPEKPKLILFFENINKRAGMMKGLARAGDIPTMGVFMGGYPGIGPHAFPPNETTKGISVLAIGGDVEVQTVVLDNVKMSIKDWEFEKQKNPDGTTWAKEQVDQARAKSMAQHEAWGEQLAKSVQVREGKTNLFLQLGCQHVPRMTWVTAGCKKVLPPSVHIFGIAGADWGGVYKNFRDMKTDRLLGVMISGDFKVAEAGSPGKDDDQKFDQVAVWRQKIEEATKELGGKPDVSLMVGCVGWHNKLEEKYAITNELLGGSAIFGAFGGGEIGRYKTGGEIVSLPGQYLIALIKNP